MLKAIFKARNNLNFEIEAKEQKDIFEQVASIQEVFSENICALCGKENLKFVVREVEDNKYYEMQCLTPKCGGKLAFSQNKKGGTLYPVRKLKDGVPATIHDTTPFDYSTNGWHRYDKAKAEAAKKRHEEQNKKK